MKILGIETSCDETAASIVKDGRSILSQVVVSSLNKHKKYGGIIPEIASRRQLECINVVVKKAVSDAQLCLNDIDAIAVTISPGLIGSLLVGISFARSLSFALGKPLIEVDHIKAHLYANFLVNKTEKNKEDIPQLPAIGLVVSGGHTSLYLIKKFNQFELLGHTVDDAVGEAFDKVSRILKTGYPGGPAIDRLAKKGEHTKLRFNCALLEGTRNFSFSGIKTAVLYYHREHGDDKDFSIPEVAYAFQDSVVSVLVKKSISVCQKLKIRTLVVGGGVAANSSLRNRLVDESMSKDIHAHFPPHNLCMDNAAMIAGLGYHMIKERTGIKK
jgi:N6-L-threonylcarbamoyladenine synthase